MRKPEFWQAFLSLDLSAAKSRELLERLGTSCVSAEDLQKSPALDAEQRKKLASVAPLSPQQQGLLNVVAVENGSYPENLRLSQSPPPAIMVRGSILPEDRNAVAIVGTRKATAYARAIAKKLAMEFASGGLTVISGAAHGVDSAAHLGALESGGRTIAVVGSGLDKPYPASHRGLLDRIAQNGAVVSQFALGTKPDWWRFPIRNHLIAALSRAVVVVEAPETSGSLLTANLAAEEGRHVFATPGPIDSLEHRGSFRLINDGATLLYTPEQVFNALGIERVERKREQPKLSGQQERILARLSLKPELPDNISEALNEPAGVILGELTRLELEGLVAKSAGGYVKL